MKNNLFIVSKEALKYIAFASISFIVFSILAIDFLALLSFFSLLFFLFIFRNPERELPMFEKFSVLSPVDGTVTQIVELDNAQYAYRIDIESNYFDIGILRVPMNNSVLEKKTMFKGTRVSTKSKLYDDLNESVALIFIDEEQNKIKIVHKLKTSFVPLCIDIKEQQRMHQTSRYGSMINGITSIYLPRNFRISVNINSDVKAAENLIGYFS